MKFQKIAIFLSVVFWPLSLFLANPNKDFLVYFVPGITTALVLYFLHKRFNQWYSFALLLTIPLISPKLALFPLLFFTFNLLVSKKTKKDKSTYIFLLVSVFVLSFTWKSFFGQTIFIPDYEARQKVLRDQKLYSSIFMARAFNNKAKIISDKFIDNFFALTDPNNYFFSFHPREAVGNQNLPKFPFVALPIFFYGLYKLPKEKNKAYIFAMIFSLFLSLSFLTNFDRNDFILWIPISIIFITGFGKLAKIVRRKNLLIAIYFLFLIPEFISMFLRFIR